MIPATGALAPDGQKWQTVDTLQRESTGLAPGRTDSRPLHRLEPTDPSKSVCLEHSQVAFKA